MVCCVCCGLYMHCVHICVHARTCIYNVVCVYIVCVYIYLYVYVCGVCAHGICVCMMVCEFIVCVYSLKVKLS